MSNPGSMGIFTVKPCCRVIVRSNSVYPRVPRARAIQRSVAGRVDSAEFNGKIGVLVEKFVRVSDSSCQKCRSLSSRSLDMHTKRDFLVFANLGLGSPQSDASRNDKKSSDRRGALRVSDIRFSSSSIDPRVEDPRLEKICRQNLGVEPLTIEENWHSHPTRVRKDDSPGGDLAEISDDLNARRENLLRAQEELIRNLEEMKANHADDVTQVREDTAIEKEAWRALRAAVVNYCGSPVGTLAANDPGDSTPLNYDQVFIRDFVPSALAFLLKGEGEIVRNFILHTLQLQSWEKTVDCYSPGQGLMPASFKVRTVPLDGSNEAFEEVLDPDFGESAIGRVAPVDSGLWWIILLRAYGKVTGDYALQERVDVQTGIKLILNLCLADGFDMFPTLLVTDGSCMIDRRMGIHGHPLEIQALFYSALRYAREMITVDDASKNLLRAVNNRLSALSFHIREYYWVDMRKINVIYRYKTEEYSHDAVNKFNIYPEQIPSWLMEWIPEKGGYLIGNLQPAHMDFRFFSLGNLWSIVSSLTTPEQSESILNLIESKWDDLIGVMPIKICFPSLEHEEWHIITGSDPKNTFPCGESAMSDISL